MSEKPIAQVRGRIYKDTGNFEILGSPDDVALVLYELSRLSNGAQLVDQRELPLANGAMNGAEPEVPLHESIAKSTRRRKLTFGTSHADPTVEEIRDFYQKWASGKHRDTCYTAREVSYRLRYLQPEHVRLTHNMLMRCGARQTFNDDGTRCRRGGCDVLTCIED